MLSTAKTTYGVCGAVVLQLAVWTHWNRQKLAEPDDSWLAQRLQLLASDQTVEPPSQASALRGSCGGAPINFRWAVPNASRWPAAGVPLRTRVVALDAFGRPARASACQGLRANVTLRGHARLAKPAALERWQNGELQLDIENEVAEAVEVDLVIDGPGPADAFREISTLGWVPGPAASFELRVQPVGAKHAVAAAKAVATTWPTLVMLEAVLSGRDVFGNRVAGASGDSQSFSGLALRSNSKFVEVISSGGKFSSADQGEARVLVRGVSAGSAELWAEAVGGGHEPLKDHDGAPAIVRLSFVDYIAQAQAVPSRQSVANWTVAPSEALSESDAEWQPMARDVRDAFLHAWSAYRRYAWGSDELQPLSKRGRDTFGNIGMFILDSLTTLKMLGLHDEFERAARFVDKDLDFDQADREVSVFELTIRALGGLLGAHALSGRKVFLDRAVELGDRLLPALSSPSGLPWPRWNIARQGGRPTGEPTILAEAGSLQLEFRYLTALTGDHRYRRAADACSEAVRATGASGLTPVHLTPPDVSPPRQLPDRLALGALADSYYEYLLKQWIQSPGEIKFRDQWLDVMDDLPSLVRPAPNQFPTDVARWDIPAQQPPEKLRLVEKEPDGRVRWKQDHLSCFAPGMIALGSRSLQRSGNSSLQVHWRQMAEGLTLGCAELWTSTKTGLAPEFVSIMPTSPFDIKQTPQQGRHSFLRPETAESLFYLYRMTGDAKYRRLGRELFHAIQQHAKVDAGYASVRDVDHVPTEKLDELQSFVMAETFKYLFLLFSPADTLDLDKYVLNTEGHPLRILGPW